MRLLISTVFLTILLVSCKDRVICPAFQSTYILDDSVRFAYYSPLWKMDKATRDKYLAETYAGGDSLAIGNSTDGMLQYFAHAGEYVQSAEEVNRSKYGIVKYEPMWLKNHKLKSAPMENVLKPKQKVETLDEVEVDVGDFVADDFGMDSLEVDSTSVLAAVEEPEAPKGPQYKYGYDPNGQNNVEQDYYNKYFGEMLVVKTRPPSAPLAETHDLEEPAIESDTTATQKKKGGFLRKKNQDDQEAEPVPADEGGSR